MPATGQNPYAVPKPSAGGAAPDPSGRFRIGGPGRYSVPDIPDSTNPEYRDGFSPEIATGGSSDGTRVPDNIRTGRRKPPENDPNDHRYTAQRYAEYFRRHSVEQVQLGQTYVGPSQAKPNKPYIPDLEQEKLPIRRTATTAPTDNLLRRPWPVPRNAAEALGPNATLHFSMADHRRLYPIMQMQPRGGIGINNIRNTPVPWDAELYAVPEENAPNMPGLFGSRRWGL